MGGESDLRIQIEQTPIKIEIIEPYDRRFIFGEDFMVSMSLAYPDGSKPRTASGRFGMDVINAGLNCDEEMVCRVVVPQEKINLLENKSYDSNVMVSDAYGNSGLISISFAPSGY